MYSEVPYSKEYEKALAKGRVKYSVDENLGRPKQKCLGYLGRLARQG